MRKKPRVLIGGLGLGFSLRRALEITGKQAVVEVAKHPRAKRKEHRI